MNKEKAIASGYRAGDSCRALARRYRVSTNSVLQALKAYGVESRRPGRYNTYCADYGFFAETDSEEKAYWLGFISADGNVSRRGEISIGLQARDRSHLELFRGALRSNHPITVSVNGAGNAVADIRIASPGMAADLAALGVVPNKTLILQPAVVRDDLMRHYWRGVVDGDGSIGKYRTSNARLQWKLSLAGSAAMVEGFRAFLVRHCGTQARVARSHGRSFTMQVLGNHMAVAAIRCLYEGATVALARKHAIAEAACRELPHHRKHAFRGQMMSASKIAAVIGMKRWTLIRRLARGWTFECATTQPARAYRRSSLQAS